MRLPRSSWLLLLAVLDYSVWMSTSTTVPKENIAQVESNLLSLFGFRKRPKIDRSKVVIPQAMLDLYKRQTGHPLDTMGIVKPGLHTRTANTVRSFTHVESPVDMKFPGTHKFRLKFDISSIPEGELLKAAEVTLSRDMVFGHPNDIHDNSHLQRILVHDIIRPGIKGKSEPIIRLMDSKLVDTRSNGTLSVDVLPAVERWLKRPDQNHGILVYVAGHGKNRKAPAHHVRLRRHVSEDTKTWSGRQPVLFTYTDDGKYKHSTGKELSQKRSRRAMVKKHRRKDHRDTCKRHQMYVDFTDVGWDDWIVAPPGYDAYYCQGDCTFPLAEHLNTTNHAIVQTLVNSVNPGQVPKACCVPTSLNSISMLYLDEENKVVLKNYKDMAVLGCGCR